MKELPKLSGSEKQVKWAETIRKKKVEEWSRVVGDNPLHQEYLEMVMKEDSAAWWISYRDSDLKAVLNQRYYGYDKVKEDLKRYRAGLEGESKKPTPPSAPTPPVPSGGVTIEASGGKTETVGPTRNRFTGEIVDDKDALFSSETMVY